MGPTTLSSANQSSPPPPAPKLRQCSANIPPPLLEEHHISNLDPSAFFSLHDYDSSTVWTPDEIRRTYGLEDESTAHIPAARKDEIVREVVKMFDYNGDGVVSREEFMAGWRDGRRLGDYGSGVGHHGDDEFEYEIHHFEKFHDESEFVLFFFFLGLPRGGGEYGGG